MLIATCLFSPALATANVVDILDQSTLDSLEQEGWAFHALPHTKSLKNLWAEHIEIMQAGVDRPLVREHRQALQYPAGNVGRAFDVRWLQHELARFRLIAVVNRMDKANFAFGGRCGHVRFIYRLQYQIQQGEKTVGSALPFTVNVLWPYQESLSCQQLAQLWQANGKSSTWTVEPILRQLAPQPSEIQINVQTVRFPSGLETEFAGQAIYLLRAYHPTLYQAEPSSDDADTAESWAVKSWAAKPLANTPDVQAIAGSSEKYQAILNALSDSQTLADGTYDLPTETLAIQALSYSTLGSNRPANKPFSQVFATTSQKNDLPEQAGYLRSQAAIIEQLNNGTCMGCHQAGAMAGFHMLGHDDPKVSGITNRLAVPFSPHYAMERQRRQHYIQRLADDETPPVKRTHSLVLEDQQGINLPCLPPQHANDYQPNPFPQCATGTECQILIKSNNTHDIAFGQCVSSTLTGPRYAGEACRAASIQPDNDEHTQPADDFNQQAYADRVVVQPLYDIPEDKRFSVDTFNCRPTRIGVPLGRAYRQCTQAERALTTDTTQEICGIVGGRAFDRCVEEDFHSCLAGVVGRGMLDSCSVNQYCREDYSCQALPWQLQGVPNRAGRQLAEQGIGFCTPTYFLFQLRLDGHPVPK